MQGAPVRSQRNPKPTKSEEHSEECGGDEVAWAERRVRGVPPIRLQGRSSLRAGGEQHRALLRALRETRNPQSPKNPPRSAAAMR